MQLQLSQRFSSQTNKSEIENEFEEKENRQTVYVRLAIKKPLLYLFVSRFRCSLFTVTKCLHRHGIELNRYLLVNGL